MLQGPNIRSYAVSWLGSVPNREDLARRLSPLTYVRAGQPPVLTIHGDADRVVPYSHAVRLHDVLNKAGVRNRLLTIPGGDHGDFPPEQQIRAYEAIHQFLAELGFALSRSHRIAFPMREKDLSAKPDSSATTIKEVAQRAGVSAATVSRALSGSAGVREPLRSRILEAAHSLSYSPNRAARDLRVRSSRAVGLLIPDIENPFFTSVVRGIEEVIGKTDYSLLLANYNEDPDQETRRLELFRAEGVRGLIFAASRTPSSLYAELGKAGTALVAVSRGVPRLRIDQVTVANREGALAATSHLIQLGHKHIALINGPVGIYHCARSPGGLRRRAPRIQGSRLMRALSSTALSNRQPAIPPCGNCLHWPILPAQYLPEAIC